MSFKGGAGGGAKDTRVRYAETVVVLSHTRGSAPHAEWSRRAHGGTHHHQAAFFAESRRLAAGLLAGLAVYLFFLIRRSRKKDNVVAEEVDEKLKTVSSFKIVIWLLIGILALWGGSELLVKGAVDLADPAAGQGKTTSH